MILGRIFAVGVLEGYGSTERKIYQQAMLGLVRRKGDGKLILLDILARLLLVLLIYLVHLYTVS